MKPMLSIIIPAYNAEEYIQKCIDSIYNNDSKNSSYEIIVVDHGSCDGTVDILKKTDVVLIKDDNFKSLNIGALRNIGAEAASGSIFVFIDADIYVPNCFLQKGLEYFVNGFEGAVGFVDYAPEDAGWVGKIWGNRLSLKRSKVINVDYLPGRNIFVNKHVFNKINGFSESLKTGEDKDFVFRILKNGYKALSDPSIDIYHLGYEKNLIDFIKKEYWRQGNTILFAKEWDFSLRSLRNPILSIWHIICFCIIIISVIYEKYTLTFLSFLLWVLPTIIITLLYVNYKNASKVLIPLFFLNFIRWNVSGIALIRQLLKLLK